MIKFINEIDGRTLFEYVPKLEEKKFFITFFEMLEKYDICLTEQRNHNGN